MEITYLYDSTVRLVQKMGGDSMIVAAARVSTSGEEALKWVDAPAEDNYGLINYLMKCRHGSPFESSSMTFFIHTPAMVWWEALRHRIGVSPNLESGRYKTLDPVFWLPRRDRPMVKPEGYKSARPKFDPLTDDKVYNELIADLKESYKADYIRYKKYVDLGLANEVIRAMLPFAIYYSGWFTCNPRSLLHFLSLRTHDPTARFVSYPQLEIQEVALQMEKLFAENWPLTHKSFVSNGRIAP